MSRMCKYKKEPCCMRMDNGRCDALGDTTFRDRKCHFRKESYYGPNLYDLEKAKKRGRRR